VRVDTTERAHLYRDWKPDVDRVVSLFESLIVGALMIMIAVVIFLSTIELGWTIMKDVSSPHFELPQIDQLLDIFGLFLIVLIGVELLASMKAYSLHRNFYVEVVLEVALISVARRVIIFEIKETSDRTLIALSVLLLALAGAYYFQKSRRFRLPAGRQTESADHQRRRVHSSEELGIHPRPARRADLRLRASDFAEGEDEARPSGQGK
jgi:uncharacterized membrane protein (DUF373 family)